MVPTIPDSPPPAAGDPLDAQLAEQQAGRESLLAANDRHLAGVDLTVDERAALEQKAAELRAEVARIVNARRGQ